jgi:hypothetical protein
MIVGLTVRKIEANDINTFGDRIRSSMPGASVAGPSVATILVRRR